MNLSREKTGMTPPRANENNKKISYHQKRTKIFAKDPPIPSVLSRIALFKPELPSIRKVNYIFTFLRFTFVQPYDIIKRKNIQPRLENTS